MNAKFDRLLSQEMDGWAKVAKNLNEAHAEKVGRDIKAAGFAESQQPWRAAFVLGAEQGFKDGFLAAMLAIEDTIASFNNSAEAQAKSDAAHAPTKYKE